LKRTGGFVDLRIQPNSRSSLSDDSVWPSFTDIMTVVVMIFLMALVVIMIRNTELGQQLQQKSEEISVIDTQKQETQSHRETLAVRLNQVQRQLNELNKRLSATRRERDETQATLVVNLQQARELKAQIEALKVLRSKLVGENEALTRDKEGLGTELAKVKQESRESRDREERRISELMRQVLSLEAIRERLIAKAESLTTQKETLDLKLTEIQQLNEKRVSEKEREIGELTRQILSLQVIREELVDRTEALSKEKNELGGALARAQKSEDNKDQINAVKQIINNCVHGKLDVENLPTFDIEYGLAALIGLFSVIGISSSVGLPYTSLVEGNIILLLYFATHLTIFKLDSKSRWNTFSGSFT